MSAPTRACRFSFVRTVVSVGLSAVLSFVISAAQPAHAGPYTDDLSKCMVAATSKDDRAVLVTWIFAAASLHPAVKSMASVTPQQLDDANKKAGELFTRLLTDACKTPARQALQYEGTGTIQASFQVFGQVAGQELVSSSEVGAAMAGLAKYIDEARLKEIGQPK